MYGFHSGKRAIPHDAPGEVEPRVVHAHRVADDGVVHLDAAGLLVPGREHEQDVRGQESLAPQEEAPEGNGGQKKKGRYGKNLRPVPQPESSPESRRQ